MRSAETPASESHSLAALGERASGDLAFEAAAQQFERALATIDLVDRPDPRLRCDIQLELGAADRDAGDERRRDTAFAAASSARNLADGDRLARASLLLVTGASVTTPGAFDEQIVGLVEEALAALGPEPTSSRAVLLCKLAGLLANNVDLERSRELAREALTLAAVRDPETLATVLAGTLAFGMFDGSRPWFNEHNTLYDEALSVADDQISDPLVLTHLHRGRAFGAACLGDRATFEAHVEEIIRIADALRYPIVVSYARESASALHAFLGDLELAERLTLEGAEYGRRGGALETNVAGILGALLFSIRSAQGRLGELVTMLEALVESLPLAALARRTCNGAHRLGPTRGRAADYQFLIEDDFTNLPVSIEFPVALCGLARMTFALRPSDSVTRTIYERFLPFAGTFTCTGFSITDAADSGLALCAAALGKFDDADAHFAAAVELCERGGARPYLARYHLDWAETLIARGNAAAAREHAEIAVDLGAEVGMTGPQGVVPQAQRLLAEL